MAPRYSAARPSRDGENFARTHHLDGEETDPKRIKFDVRNPSKLAADEREDDAILDADVIGGSAATKRGAVNIDGYDSDSDNETFNARAASRKKKGDIDILKEMDNYNANDDGGDSNAAAGGSAGNDDNDEDDDDDMFAPDAPGPSKADEEDVDVEFDKAGKKKKNVHFLDASQIKGQVAESKTGGRVRLDDEESSDDEADIELAVQEEGIDEEVGAGGLKRNAPKVEAFNLRDEMEEGRFDQEGNFVRRAGDPDAVHDSWLEGVSKKEMKKAADTHQKREDEARHKRIADDEVLVPELLSRLISRLEMAETPLEALARLGKGQTKTKKVPQWKLKKMASKKNGHNDTDQMNVRQQQGAAAEDPAQARIKEAIDAITDAADKLLSRDYEDIYDQEREMLVREYQRETGEAWVEPAKNTEGDETQASSKMWEFRWTDGRDGAAKQGPYDGPTMKAWQDAGYFGEGVEFRPADGVEAWSRTATFT